MSHQCHDEHEGHGGGHNHGGHSHNHDHDHSDDVTPALQHSLYQHIRFDEVEVMNESVRRPREDLGPAPRARARARKRRRRAGPHQRSVGSLCFFFFAFFLNPLFSLVMIFFFFLLFFFDFFSFALNSHSPCRYPLTIQIYKIPIYPTPPGDPGPLFTSLCLLFCCHTVRCH